MLGASVYDYYNKDVILYDTYELDNFLNFECSKSEKVRQEDYEVPWLSGCSLFGRADIFRYTLIDERYFLYVEDIAYSLELKKRNIRLIVSAKAKVWHKESISTKKLSNLKLYYQWRNKLLVSQKYMKFPYKIMFWINNFFVIPIRILRRYLKGVLVNKKYIYYAVYEWFAFRDFIMGRDGKFEGKNN